MDELAAQKKLLSAANARAAKQRHVEERRAQWLRDRGWICIKEGVSLLDS